VAPPGEEEERKKESFLIMESTEVKDIQTKYCGLVDVILPLGSLSQMQLLFHNQGNEPTKDFRNRGTYTVTLIISVFMCMWVCAGQATQHPHALRQVSLK
jgi:hypothetical protein